MAKGSDRKYWILILVALFLFLAMFLYFNDSVKITEVVET